MRGRESKNNDPRCGFVDGCENNTDNSHCDPNCHSMCCRLLEVNLSPACESRTPWMSEMLDRTLGEQGGMDVTNPQRSKGSVQNFLMLFSTCQTCR